MDTMANGISRFSNSPSSLTCRIQRYGTHKSEVPSSLSAQLSESVMPLG